MRVIIVGLGKVGLALAGKLAEEHSVTAVDLSLAVVKPATENHDIIGVVGNGATIKILQEAGVDGADLVVAVTGGDETNLMCCLLAKKLGAKHTVARVRNPEYEDGLKLIKDDLRLSMAVNPEREAANEAARMLKFPSAITVDVFAKGRLELLTLTVRDGSPIEDMSIKDIFSKLRSRVLVCYVERGGKVFIPSGDTVLHARDTIGVLAAPATAAAFFKELGLASSAARRVMIVGGGKIAYYLAKQLLDLKMRVTVIESDEAVALGLSERLPGAVIIHGDGSDKDLLLSEGLADMDALCCLTGIDEENILLALYAHSVSERIKTVTKVTRINFEDVLQKLDIGSAIYPRYITADLITRYVRALGNSQGSNVETLYRLLDGRAEALEFRVGEGSPLAGVPFSRLRLRKNLLVGSIVRGREIITPRGSDCLEAGDTVIIVTTEPGLNDLDDIMES